jgi:hypothetical protein
MHLILYHINIMIYYCHTLLLLTISIIISIIIIIHLPFKSNLNL